MYLEIITEAFLKEYFSDDLQNLYMVLQIMLLSFYAKENNTTIDKVLKYSNFAVVYAEMCANVNITKGFEHVSEVDPFLNDKSSVDRKKLLTNVIYSDSIFANMSDYTKSFLNNFYQNIKNSVRMVKR